MGSKLADAAWTKDKNERWATEKWKGPSGGDLADESSDYCANYSKEHRRARQLMHLKCLTTKKCFPALNTMHVSCDIVGQMLPQLLGKDTALEMTDAFVDRLAAGMRKLKFNDARLGWAAGAKDLMDVVGECMVHVLKHIENKWKPEDKCEGEECDKYLCPSDFN